MLREQAQQLHARVPGTADDSRLDHESINSRNKKAALRRLSIGEARFSD
jgi:hypothetical protein